MEKAKLKVAENKANGLIGTKPKWDTFDPAKVRASIKAGNILPELKPRINAVYTVKLLTVPKEVKYEKKDREGKVIESGVFNTVDVNHDGMRKTLKTNQSFLFKLKIYHEDTGFPYSMLVGKELVIQKDEDGFMSVQIEGYEPKSK